MTLLAAFASLVFAAGPAQRPAMTTDDRVLAWPEAGSVKNIDFYVLDWSVDYFAKPAVDQIRRSNVMHGQIQGAERFLAKLNDAKLKWSVCVAASDCVGDVRTVLDFTLKDGTQRTFVAGTTGVIDLREMRWAPSNKAIRLIVTFGWLDQ